MKLRALLRLEGLDPERRVVLVAECCAFLRAGGTLTLDDWEAMSPDGREVMSAAGEAVERARGRTLADEGAQVQAEALGLLREHVATAAALDAAVAEVGA